MTPPPDFPPGDYSTATTFAKAKTLAGEQVFITNEGTDAVTGYYADGSVAVEALEDINWNTYRVWTPSFGDYMSTPRGLRTVKRSVVKLRDVYSAYDTAPVFNENEGSYAGEFQAYSEYYDLAEEQFRDNGKVYATLENGLWVQVPESRWDNEYEDAVRSGKLPTRDFPYIAKGQQVKLPNGQQGTVLEVRGGQALVEVKATPVKRALADAYQMTKQAFATLQVPNGSQTELLLYAGDVIDTATEEVLPDGTVTFYAPDGDVIQVSMSWVNANAMPLGGSTSQSQPAPAGYGTARIGSSIIVPRDNTILYFADISSAINGMGERGYIPAGETGRVIDYQADAYIVQMDNGQYGYTALSDMTMDAGFANWL